MIHPKGRIDSSPAPPVSKPVPPVKPIIERLFDKVIVISLEQSHARRAYIHKYLSESGIQKYEFFNATSASDPLVTQAYANNDVATFPPCFRCGKLDCGNPDCNNFLIPQQVATFITYRRLWQAVADGEVGRILVNRGRCAVSRSYDTGSDVS